MGDRAARPAVRVARAHRSLRRWTGALIGTAAVVRTGVGVLSFFAIGPLSGLAAYPLWEVLGDGPLGEALGNGPIVAEWVATGLLVLTGIAVTWERSIQACGRARVVGWVVVVDTVVYVASIVVELVAELEYAGDLWWRLLAAIVTANVALAAAGAVVVRKAASVRRIHRELLRGHYVRKPRPAGTGTAW